ncbi:MAG: histidine phosphatase family protein [Burkholderiaceae bacterium]|nr:histidine phosphatase family protein [Burkholderiaceae bacterium]
MTELWLMRHGETDWNIVHRLQGWRDIGLNNTGLGQAARLADRLATEGKAHTFHAAYSSDMARTVNTLAPAAARLGLPVETTPTLRERHYGSLEGLTVDELSLRAAPAAYRAWSEREIDGDVGGGETLRTFHERIVGAVDAIAQRHSGERVLVMTHGGALDIIWRYIQGISLAAKARRARMLNASINIVQVDDTAWRVKTWGDVAHMTAPVGNDVVA